jgi:hypothetical protein
MRSEIIAILAGGTSYMRFLRPYFFWRVILASILYIASKEFIPKGNEIRSNFHVKYFDRQDLGQVGYKELIIVVQILSSYIGIKYYDSIMKTCRRFFSSSNTRATR